MEQHDDKTLQHSHTPALQCLDVAAGLVFRDGKLLITQRHEKAHLGGFWEFPGGKREAHESFQECLCRELREELGIDVEVGEMVEEVTHAYPEKAVRLRFFLCRWLRHEPRALDCPDFRWITLPRLGDYEFPAADAQLLRTLKERKELWR